MKIFIETITERLANVDEIILDELTVNVTDAFEKLTPKNKKALIESLEKLVKHVKENN